MTEKRGRGRPPTGKIAVKVRLSPAELATCLRHGDNAQEGISRIIGTQILFDQGLATRTETTLAYPEPPPVTTHVRWVCKALKCYTHPANYGDFCSECKSPRPA